MRGTIGSSRSYALVDIYRRSASAEVDQRQESIMKDS